MKPDAEGRARAAELVRHQMPNMSPAQIADRASLDPATVRDFLDGERWPRGDSRSRLEDAADLPLGALEAAARGEYQAAPSEDPVEVAVHASRLTRPNQHRLLGTYYELLENQGDREVRGA